MKQMAARAVTDRVSAPMIAGAIPLIDVAGHLGGDAEPSRRQKPRAEGQRAQYRLSADLKRRIAAGRRAGPQAKPERSLFPAPRAHPRRSRGDRKPPFSRPQS